MNDADFPEDVDNAGGEADPDTERVKAADFLCNCKISNYAPCSTRYSVEDLLATRYEMAELTRGRPYTNCLFWFVFIM